MEDRRIPDSRITVSSFKPCLYYGPTNARLNRCAGGGTTGAWKAGSKALPQWIQVNFSMTKNVSGVVLQGRDNSNQWVTHYKVQYGNGNGTLLDVMNQQNQDVMVRYDSIIHIYTPVHYLLAVT